MDRSFKLLENKIFLSLLLLCAFTRTTIAQQDSSHLGYWAFESQPYLNPLAAESRASQMRVDLSLYTPYTYSNAVPKNNFSLSPKNILGMDITTGKEMPIVGHNSRDVDIGFFLPVSFFMLWDLRGESFPIVNTDYRFGGLLKVFFNSQHLLSEVISGVNQDSVQFTTDDAIERGTGLRLGLYHESSHLGDELMIFAIQGKDSIDFKRINVSYEFVDVSYIENFYLKNGMFIQLGTGLVVPVAIMNSKLQYYDDTLLYPFHSVIAQKKPHTEFYTMMDLHWNREQLWIPNFFSLELRNRDVYDYSFSTNDYESILTYNALIGWRKSKDNGNKNFLHSLGDVYFRLYYGINPHGQFREQKKFFLVAFGLRILG